MTVGISLCFQKERLNAKYDGGFLNVFQIKGRHKYSNDIFLLKGYVRLLTYLAKRTS